MFAAKILPAVLLCCILSACHTASPIMRSFRFDEGGLPARTTARKVLVVALASDTALTFRRQLEESLAENLRQLSIEGVCYLDVFGPKGLSNMKLETVYAKLCDKNIDAVLPIVLVDKKSEKGFRLKDKNGYKGLYYFQRIWNYQKIQAQAAETNIPGTSPKYYWEVVLFDLHSLMPKYVLQVRPFDTDNTKEFAEQFTKLVIGNMQQRKVLPKTAPAFAKPVAFLDR